MHKNGIEGQLSGGGATDNKSSILDRTASEKYNFQLAPVMIRADEEENCAILESKRRTWPDGALVVGGQESNGLKIQKMHS